MSAHGHAVRLRWTTIMLLVTLPGAACRGWHTEDVAPQAVLAAQQPSQVRVTRTDGQRFVLQHPELRGDSLEGAWQLGGYGTATPMRIALTDVRQVATRGFSSDRTVVLFIGLGAVQGGPVFPAIRLAPGYARHATGRAGLPP